MTERDWPALCQAARRARARDATDADKDAALAQGLRLLRTTHNAVFSVTDPADAADEGPHYCLKLLGDDSRRAPETELHALRLLEAEDYPFAPRAVYFDPTPPCALVVTFVDGREMSKRPLSSAELGALADALRPLYRITPDTARDQTAARALPTLRHAGNSGTRVKTCIDELASAADPADPHLRAEALDLAARWLAGPDADLLALPSPPVFSRCDINFSNCLWDGRVLRLVDLEMAGWRDRAYDLSDTVELDYAWSYSAGYEHTPEDRWDAFIHMLALTPDERARYEASRRAFAVFWTLRQVATATDDAKLAAAAQQLAHAHALLA